jgi:pseudomonalisin
VGSPATGLTLACGVRTVVALAGLALACGSTPPSDDTHARTFVDGGPVVELPGHVPAWALRARDLGALPSDTPVTQVTAVLGRSPETEEAWAQWLVDLQTPGSPSFHHWLTPEEIAARFGATPADIDRTTAWLLQHGLRVDRVSRSGTMLTFSGTAGSLGEALGTELHAFDAFGESRISAVFEPKIPASLAGVVRFFAGLSTSSPRAGGHGRAGNRPDFTSFGGDHYIAPSDFATIYDLGPVYADGLDGTGQTIAIVGRSRVAPTDISEFQTETGLPVVAATVIIPPAGIDPGAPGNDDQLEATIDVTRAASVASGATIDLVVSGTPMASMLNGLGIAIEYVVDNDTAPVLNISFLECEQTAGSTWTQFYATLFQQAATEGMSVFVSSGDSGVAGCDDQGTTPPATQVASTNYLCASGSVTCVGGTEFADEASPGTYWSPSNTPVLGSAKSYIPEGGWNEPLNLLDEPQVWASGGGVSIYVAKPSWQSGTGVPADGYRDTPDIAFSASAHDGYYACYAAGGVGNCADDEYEYIYGTSAAAPSMAGIAAIANQKVGSPQGNFSPLLYTLAAGPAASAVFHDVTVATSAVPSCTALPSMCDNSTAGPTGVSGGLAGYTVGVGFDQVTGWGSLDVASFLATFGCVGQPDGTACDDGNACTLKDACLGGLCVGGDPVVCPAPPACHAVGTCVPTTGVCSAPVASPDGTPCNDGNACTRMDACHAGVCAGVAKVCTPEDACHSAGVCEVATGLCTNPPKPGACQKDAGQERDAGQAADAGGEGPPPTSGCACAIGAGADDRATSWGVGTMAVVGLLTWSRRRARGARPPRES